MTHDLHHRLRTAAAELTGQPVTIAELAAMHGPAAQGTLLVLLATPCVLPLPGVGNVMGLALIALAVAMWRGDKRSALPARVATMQLSAAWARRVLGMLATVYALASHWSQQRLTHVAGPGPHTWLAATVALMGGLIFLPIPFGNILPALALVVLGLGLAFRDGLAVLLATAVAGAAIAYSVALGVMAWSLGVAPLVQMIVRP